MDSAPQFVSANSFGVKLVVVDAELGLRILLNDAARHGIQSTDAARSDEPLAYYHRSGPLGDVFAAWQGPDANARVAIVGLGVGAMAAYAEPGQHFTFYEIDPMVADIAGDSKYFTFLARCRGTYEIVLGDGLEALARAPDGHYGMIILDAFTSDRIPMHLLSRQALDVYRSKLDDGGVLVFHISNVHQELEPALARLAAEADWGCLARADLDLDEEERSIGKLPSHYLVIARRPEDLRRLAENDRWRSPSCENAE